MKLNFVERIEKRKLVEKRSCKVGETMTKREKRKTDIVACRERTRDERQRESSKAHLYHTN